MPALGEMEATIRVETFFDGMVEAKNVQVGDWYQFSGRWFRVSSVEPVGFPTIIRSVGRDHDERDFRHPEEGVVVRRQVEQHD